MLLTFTAVQSSALLPIVWQKGPFTGSGVCAYQSPDPRASGVPHGGAQADNGSEARAHDGPQLARPPRVRCRRRARTERPCRPVVAARGGAQALQHPPAPTATLRRTGVGPKACVHAQIVPQHGACSLRFRCLLWLCRGLVHHRACLRHQQFAVHSLQASG